MKHRSVGVVVPAHDEADLIGVCLASIESAASVAAATRSVVVHVVVACDACGDDTAAIVTRRGHRVVHSDARNVGIARARGADLALGLGVDWLAFTDADSTVDPSWIVAQLALDADVVCGTVAVDDWGRYGDAMRTHFEQTYHDRDGHRHIHGANLGMSADAYRSVGGFEALANSEDVAIVAALQTSGARIAWSAAPRVVTSARLDYRATAGFGFTLSSVASGMESATSL